MAEIKLKLDPCNPGQFYACCGLFELVAAESPGAAAYFCCEESMPRRAEFVIVGRAIPELGSILQALRDLRCEQLEKAEPSIDPVQLHISGRPFVLDWWLDEFRLETTNLKCWAGQVTTRKLFDELPKLIDPVKAVGDPLQFAGMTKSKFGADPRAAWNALDSDTPQCSQSGRRRVSGDGGAHGDRAPGLSSERQETFDGRILLVDGSFALAGRAGRGGGAMGRTPALRLPVRHRQTRAKLQVFHVRTISGKKGLRPMSDVLKRFDEWLQPDGPVAVTVRTPLEPVMGKDSVLFPPTFAPQEKEFSARLCDRRDQPR